MPCSISSYCPRDPGECYARVLSATGPLPGELVCYELAVASVERFASSRILVRNIADSKLAGAYPLPLGTDSLAAWAARAGIEPGEWAAPLTAWRDAWLGLAVERRVEHDAGENLNALDGAALMAWFKEHAQDHRERLRPRATSVWLLGLVKRERVERDAYSWRFVEPAVIVESQALTTSDAQTVARSHGQLLAWYRRRVLGRHIPVGRPAGTGTWQSAADFEAVVLPVLRDLRRRHPGQRVPAAEVLRRLRGQLGDIDQAAFSRWLKALGWPTWDAFLQTHSD